MNSDSRQGRARTNRQLVITSGNDRITLVRQNQIQLVLIMSRELISKQDPQQTMILLIINGSVQITSVFVIWVGTFVSNQRARALQWII